MGWIEVAGGERRLGGGEGQKSNLEATREQTALSRTSCSQPQALLHHSSTSWTDVFQDKPAFPRFGSKLPTGFIVLK